MQCVPKVERMCTYTRIWRVLEETQIHRNVSIHITFCLMCQEIQYDVTSSRNTTNIAPLTSSFTGTT
jgi:hypothetical protein